MGKLQNILGFGGSGFMTGLTQGLDLMARRSQLDAQEEHLKEQTKVLKAQQLLHDEQIKAKAKLAQAIMGQMPQTVGMPESTQGQSMGVDVGPAPPQVTIPGSPPDPRQMLGLALQSGMPLTADLLGITKSTEHVLSPGQTLYRGNQPSYTAPTPPMQIPAGYPPIGGQPPSAGVSTPETTSAVQPGPGGAPQTRTTIPGVWVPTLYPETGKTELRFHPLSPTEMKNQADVKVNTELSSSIKDQVDSGKPNFQGIVNAAQGIDTPYAQRMMMWAQGELDKLRPAKQTGDREAVAEELFGMSWDQLTQQQKGAVNAKLVKEYKTDPGIDRLTALQRAKPISVIDTKMNNATATMSWGAVEDANLKEPGRYLQAGTPEAGIRVKAQYYGLTEAQRGNRIFDTEKGKDVTTAVGTSKTAFNPDTMVSIPKEKAADMQLALARRNSYVSLSKDIESELGQADQALQRGQIKATEWAKRTTGSSVLWKKIAALNDHALTSMRVLTGGAPRSEMMLEISKEAFGNISPGTSRQVVAQARENFLIQMDEQIKGYQYGLQTPNPPAGGIVPGVGEGGAMRPMKPFNQMSDAELQQFLK